MGLDFLGGARGGKRKEQREMRRSEHALTKTPIYVCTIHMVELSAQTTETEIPANTLIQRLDTFQTHQSTKQYPQAS